MIYKVLDRLSARTNAGILELQPGQLINLNTEKAKRLMQKGVIISLRDTMLQEYRQFMQWLGNHDITSDEIKNFDPDIHQNLISAIEELDNCYYRDDYQGFINHMERAKRLYLEAVKEI
jgi:hypothetical protein